MRTVNVRSIYRLTILTQDSGWKEIYNKVREIAKDGEEILLDFNGITVYEPYRHFHFKELFKMKNVRFKFYSLAKAYEQLRVMCKLEGLSDDKVIDVEPNVVEKPDKLQLKIDKYADDIMKYFDINGEVLSITVSKAYRKLNNSLTAKYIEVAAEKHIKNNPNIKELMVDLREIVVASSVIDILVDMKLHFEKDFGVEVAFNIDDEKTIENIKLHMHTKVEKEYTTKEKVKEFRKINPGTVGILIMYKKSRAKDEFGRYGKGEVLSARVAKFENVSMERLSDGDERLCAEFTSFSGNTLYTREHWLLENDGEELEKLDTNKVIVPVDEIGLYDKFLGSNAHFARPIQEDESESIIMRRIDDNGSVKNVKYNLPERIEAVFNDFNIYYDKEELNAAKIDTEMRLCGKEE